MKKILNAFSKDKLQKVLFFGLIVLVFGVFVVSIIVGNSTTEDPIDNNNPDTNKPNIDDEDGDDDKDPIKNVVIEKYASPCNTTTTSIMRHFYSVDSDTATQEMSLIQYGSKYFISRGVTYINENDETFDVLASLSGTVSEVTETSLYGNTIIINHGDGITTEYIGVSNVIVAVGDEVAQGEKIASSGTAEYDVAASNHVHFKIAVNGTYYDPEKLINTEKKAN